MAQTIDPAFQGAPYLGDSSFDPVEFVRTSNLSKYKNQLAKQAELKKDFDKGLKDISMEIKYWEDEKGGAELRKDLSTIENAYVALGTKGYNITSPTNDTERELSGKLKRSFERIREKHDVWQRSKLILDEARKVLQDQAEKPDEERDIDVDATKANIADYFSAEGSIMERNKIIPNLIVNKARPVDISKYFMDAIPKVVPGTDKLVTSWLMDPASGKFLKTTWEGVEPKRAKAGILKIADNAPANIKKAIDQAYQNDPDKGDQSKDDWVVNRFMPEYGTKTDKTATGGKGGKGGIEFNFLGGKTTMEPGTLQDTPRPYGTGVEGRTYTNYYEFKSKDVFKVPLGAKGSTYFMGQGWLPIENGGDVEANLLFYDSNRDEFVFRTTQSGVAPFTMNNMTIAVPRKNLGDQVDDLPIEVDGVIKKLKDVYGPGPKVKTIGGIDFRPKVTEEKTESGKKQVAGKDFKGTEVYTPSNTKK